MQHPPRTAQRLYLYRIMRFEHLVWMFKNKALLLASPGTWDDPYELKLSDPVFDSVFAQCWSTTPVSDAMWRIYSPNHTSVRIRVRREVLRAEVLNALKPTWRSKLDEITYLKTADLESTVRQVAKDLQSNFDPLQAIQSLFWKRQAFSHESEVRLVVYAPNESHEDEFVTLPIDPHAIIEDVMIDPRASDELLDVFKYYLRVNLKFRGNVRKSQLYSPFHALTVRADA